LKVSKYLIGITVFVGTRTVQDRIFRKRKIEKKNNLCFDNLWRNIRSFSFRTRFNRSDWNEMIFRSVDDSNLFGKRFIVPLVPQLYDTRRSSTFLLLFTRHYFSHSELRSLQGLLLLYAQQQFGYEIITVGRGKCTYTIKGTTSVCIKTCPPFPHQSKNLRYTIASI